MNKPIYILDEFDSTPTGKEAEMICKALDAYEKLFPKEYYILEDIKDDR